MKFKFIDIIVKVWKKDDVLANCFMAIWYMYDLWLRMKLIVKREVTLVLTEAVCLVAGAFSPTGIPESV